MNRKYIIPVVLLLGLAFMLILIPPKKSHDEIPPEELLRQITSPSRFISPDDVADRLIKKDPSLMLIDVRSKSEYENFALPGALNIPFQDLLKPENLELLSQEGIDFVFYSNGDVLSDQMWIIGERKGIDNIYVMKGGLNQWFDSFFFQQMPAETASAEDLALWQFRNGVRQYFTGAGPVITQQDNKVNIQVSPKKKKSAAEGGC